MKNTIYKAIILCVCMLIMTGCNNKSNKDESNVFAVDKNMYSDNYIDLICKCIYKDGIEFEISNKSSNNITVGLNIGLDGIGVKLHSDLQDWELLSGETKSCKLTGTINYTEHSSMSLHGNIYIDGYGIQSFDVCKFDLGGNSNIEEEFSQGYEKYKSDNLIIEYIDADAQGINFKIINNRTESIIIGFESFSINNDNQDYAGNVITVTPCTTQIYSVDILSYNTKYLSDNLISFNGIMMVNIDEKGVVDRMQISHIIK